MYAIFDVAELKALFSSGTNLMETLRRRQNEGQNSPTTILYSYDIQVAELKALFSSGTNLMETLRRRQNEGQNSPTTILYSYDIQAGSYLAALEDPEHRAFRERHGAELAAVIDGLR